jgi:hypothetical protein
VKQANVVSAAIGLALLGSAAAAEADVLAFSGSWTDSGIAGPDSSCDPLPFHGQASGTGTSTLGTFTYNHDICFSPVIPADPNFIGTFALDFGADSLFGTLTGSDTPDAIPGVFDLDWTYTILGGTGRFLDASGGFTAIGTSDGRNPPTVQSLAFSGLVDAPAVPEPRTWELLLLGFGLVGWALRSRRRAGSPQLA